MVNFTGFNTEVLGYKMFQLSPILKSQILRLKHQELELWPRQTNLIVNLKNKISILSMEIMTYFAKY